MPDASLCRAAHQTSIKQATCDFEAADDWRDWRIQITAVSDLPLLTVLFPFRTPDVAAPISASLAM
jgi:hypothetical protein